jgi:L-lactate dehydrogenase complex protein LldG
MTDSAGLDGRVSAFAAAARAAAATVAEQPDADGAAALLTEIAGDHAIVATGPVADGPIGAALRAAGARLRVPRIEGAPGDNGDERERGVAAVADASVGVTRGVLAVAETGSVLVDEYPLDARAVSMLSRHLVQVVDREDVVASLDDVAVWLAARGGRAGFASLVTGPSRTADIERSLTVGVQGPDEVTVVVVG